jgi:hypothetical protein
MTKHLKLYCYFEIDFWIYIANPKNFEYQILGPTAAPPFWRNWWRHHPFFVLEHNKTNKNSIDTIFL